MKDQAAILAQTIQRCRERNIILPTYHEMAHPEAIPEGIVTALQQVGLWDVSPLNLFRITWKNEPVATGGGFGAVNYLELPRELTGVAARILVLLGKYFPTGSHKVGATFGPLVERLITGRFDPTRQKALWPSTGNYCRGGAYNARLLDCPSIAVLPEEMSPERFEWLKNMGSEIITTPGGESNVKEIYDRVRELLVERGDEIVVLNQFEEFGNSRWHYAVTGPAMEEVFQAVKGPEDRLSALFLTQGSTGTLGCGDYLREKFPRIKIGVGEAEQCPTLLYNGYGFHRIEGIGDKHVPWIHHVKNMDVVVDIDDETVLHLMRLFNEPAGREFLKAQGVAPEFIQRLDHFGLSSIANIVGAIKLAKYFEFTARDTIFTVATDSMELYQSRLREARERWGEYTPTRAAVDYEGRLWGLTRDAMLELTYYDKKRMHNLKYFTWVEQLGKSVAELEAQWYDKDYWRKQYSQIEAWDERIQAFNEQTGVQQKYR
jgi:cysteine synthase